MEASREPTEYPREPPRGPCDLVMKGGITSGVVYPKAVLTLAREYRFASVGGASAGAIAAAVTAASEYGRQRGKGEGGFRELEKVADEIAAPGFIERLFQPAPGAERVFGALLAFATSRAPGRAKVVRLMSRILLGQGSFVLLALATVAAVAVAAWLLLRALDPVGVLEVAAVLVLAAGALVAGLAAAAAAGGKRAWRRLDGVLRRNWFGLCPGTEQPGREEALSEWLYARIQDCAGLPHDRPLTFADLEALEKTPIRLSLVTTNLSAGRPEILPLESWNPYLYDPAELRRFVPAEVAAHLDLLPGEPVTLGGRTLRRVPGKELPIFLGARLSLSFPILLSAVRFYAEESRAADGYVEHWFSDGGISSNFPIHSFDSWLPRHPTFGIDLMGPPDPRLADRADRTSGEVYMPENPLDPAPVRWVAVTSVGQFFGRVFDTARNWRDILQAELPGFRERVCHVRLRKEEGGLNLNMEPEIVRPLVERGAAAGAKMLEFDLEQHRYTRYLTLMQMLEIGFRQVQGAFERSDAGPGFGSRLVADELPEEFAYRRSPEWRAAAAAATRELLRVSSEWGPSKEIGFDRAEDGLLPEPKPVKRIVPRV